jgi:SAM-dependent methyltransferase
VASHYASHRPTYPDGLFAWLANQAGCRERVWDCATGSGQAAVALADHFDEVLATDASSSQIEAAKPWPGVVYRVAPADDSGLAPQSVDLVTVAQALHWFDLEPFYAEVRRVLKPAGLLAVWTYGVFQAEGSDTRQVQALLDQFYYQTVGPYWPAERRHVENGYAELPFPFDELAVPPFAMAVDWNLDDLAGYLRSWSATGRYQEQNGSDPVEVVCAELAPHWGAGRRRVVWPLSCKVGRLTP